LLVLLYFLSLRSRLLSILFNTQLSQCCSARHGWCKKSLLAKADSTALSDVTKLVRWLQGVQEYEPYNSGLTRQHHLCVIHPAFKTETLRTARTLRILEVGPRWRKVASLTPPPLYPQGDTPVGHIHLIWRRIRPNCRSLERTPVVQPATSNFTDRANQVIFMLFIFPIYYIHFSPIPTGQKAEWWQDAVLAWRE
jgi:hypothetical protein